jgi:hypothetical protein
MVHQFTGMRWRGVAEGMFVTGVPQSFYAQYFLKKSPLLTGFRNALQAALATCMEIGSTMTRHKKISRWGLERLESRFAPSSLLPSSGGRASSRDKQAMEITHAEQAAYYLAATTFLSQNGNASSAISSTVAQHDVKNEESTYPQTREVRPDDPPPFPGAVLIAVQCFAIYLVVDSSGQLIGEQCRSEYLYEWYPPDILTSVAQPIGYVVATGERLPSFKHTLQLPSLHDIDDSSHDGSREMNANASNPSRSSSEALAPSAPTSTEATVTAFAPEQVPGQQS